MNEEDEEIIADTTVPPPPNPTPVNPTPIINEVNELTIEVENLTLDDGAPLPPHLSTTPMPEPSSFIEPVVEPPLPENLSTSPMPEPTPVVEEEVVEPVIIDINYKKMKVVELKKLCKSRGIKGYSKLKKKQLIELLQ
jgi:hypothetical protein